MTHLAHRFVGARLRDRLFGAGAVVALCAAGFLVTLVGGAAAAPRAVPLGTAGTFAVLAGSGITNTGPTTVSGDVGTFPTTSETGTASLTIHGANHAGDAVTQGAKNDLASAYTTAAGEGPTTAITADLAGQALAPGVYNSASSIGLTGVLTLNGGGDPNAVFVFQAGSTLTTGSASAIRLINGAQSCNVYWQVGSSATLGTASTFRGTIIALTSITVTTGVTVDGRVLARNGAVTLDSDTIARPTCAAATGTTTSTAPTTSTTTSTSTAPTTSTSTTTTATSTAPTTTATSTAAKSNGKKHVVKKHVAKKHVAAKKGSQRKHASSRNHARPPERRHVGLTG